jgi:hypothetical protein
MRVIDRIAQVLASTGALGTFATRRTASANELRLDVVGVGPIPLPLSPANARCLCGIARPARYGLRDQTLLDRNVRDAWEIGKRQVKIDARRWRRTLEPEIEHIARDLGLPEGCAPSSTTCWSTAPVSSSRRTRTPSRADVQPVPRGRDAASP